MDQLWHQAQEPVSSSTRSDLSRAVLELSTCSSSAAPCAHGWGSSFVTNMAGNGLKYPAPPFRAVRVILSLATWIKIEDEGLNEIQITVASVLPSNAGVTGIQGLASAITKAWILLSSAVLQLQRQIQMNWCSVQTTLHPNYFQIHLLFLTSLESIYRIKP